ncbi:MAG TPA: FAD-dependent tricarballylate dehydrogenase TcuA [Galbitalea sp.]|jgi:tricarballylate dehydrogenase|nr:FAD-dependent tricarballylate dehydrogenase TcuA [Galbitalea sp.]
MTPESTDVLVIGAGNAALCAALSAREQGARVIVVESANVNERGGNTTFTAGAMRVVYDGVDELLELMPDLDAEQAANTDFGAYTRDNFFDDIERVTDYRSNPELAATLVDRSHATLSWMRDKGVRFAPIYGRQAFLVDGRFTFWGGLTIEAVGGGPGLIESLTEACDRNGVEIRYGHRAVKLLQDEAGSLIGVRIRHEGRYLDILAKSVVLASGGFESNPEWRARYLGPGWDLARVRGTRHNMGDGIRMALELGANPAGNWSGCHAVAWDLNAPEFGDLRVGDGFQKHSYPFGIIINNLGKRFVDEGADFRNYTYAKYGREILNQPGQQAWQIFDSRVSSLLRDEYRIKQVTRVTANSIEELAERMEGVSGQALVATIEEFNAAVDTDTPFNPNIRDGRSARGVVPPKTNWANQISEPPFEAYAVTCGVTFTFGGLRIDPTSAAVVDTDRMDIPGLFACGELVGGIFYGNYPGGSGLTSGAVFGKIAGASAARSALGAAKPSKAGKAN